MNKKHYKRLVKKLNRQRWGITQLQIRIQRKYLKYRFLSKIRNIPWPTLCDEISGIQPMNGPTGTVFQLNLPK